MIVRGVVVVVVVVVVGVPPSPDGVGLGLRCLEKAGLAQRSRHKNTAACALIHTSAPIQVHFFGVLQLLRVPQHAAQRCMATYARQKTIAQWRG